MRLKGGVIKVHTPKTHTTYRTKSSGLLSSGFRTFPSTKHGMRVFVYNRTASLNQVVPSYPALFSISGSVPQPRSFGSNLHLKRLGKSKRMI